MKAVSSRSVAHRTWQMRNVNNFNIKNKRTVYFKTNADVVHHEFSGSVGSNLISPPKRKIPTAYRSEFYTPLPPGHSFPMVKYLDLYHILWNEGIIDDSTTICPNEVDWKDLTLVHSPKYIEGFQNGTLSEMDIRRIGIPVTPDILKRWRTSVQGTVDVARKAVIEKTITGNIAGGYHHSFADFGSGYCAFNDIGVAVRKLQLEGLIQKALVVDLDTHQGDGTASIFENDENVFTFSMHGEKNFPLRKMKSTLDVNLPDKCNDTLYLTLLQENLTQIFQSFRPDIVFYVAGVDVFEGDKLGRLSVTEQGIRERERWVLDFCFTQQGVPVVLLTGGGYAATSELTANLHAIVFREASKID